MELDQTADRARYTQAILDSDARRRLIVAGPGTGKSYTFQLALQDIDGDGLALTFINNLADELADDLGDLASTGTFHGYCKHLLHSNPVQGLTAGFDYYPPLFEILASDTALVEPQLDADADEIDRVYQDLEEDNRQLELAVELAEYYNATTHTDAVYRVFCYFRDNPDSIPSYDLIVVDEYQDFTRLETEFINSLSEHNDVLIAGDDDQALYGFRHASAEYIREAAQDNAFPTFDLPYCSRCPRVVVNAFHDFVDQATARGLLPNRIDKPFTCYLPDKEEVSRENPNLIHASCTVERSNAQYMGRYVTTQIEDIPTSVIEDSHAEPAYPTALVVGPSPFLDSVHEVLDNSFNDVELKKGDGDLTIGPADAYRRIMSDRESRLGWRILTYLKPVENAEVAIEQAINDNLSLYSLLPEDYIEHHLTIVSLLEKYSDEQLSDQEREFVEDELDESLEEAFPELAEGEEEDSDGGEAVERQSEELQPSIVCTSMSGAKGMSAAYVFIVGLMDEHLPRDPHDVTNTEVRKLLVSLTRTRVRCYLVSCRNYAGNWLDSSTFIDWFADDRLTTDDVDADRLEALEG